MRWNERGSCSKVAFFLQVKAGFHSHKYAAARHKWLTAWKQLCTAEELEHKSEKFGLKLRGCFQPGCWWQQGCFLPGLRLPKAPASAAKCWASRGCRSEITVIVPLWQSLPFHTPLQNPRVSLEYSSINWDHAFSVSVWVQPPINGIGGFCALLEHSPLLTLLCYLGVYCNLLCFILKGKRKTISASPTLPNCSWSQISAEW